MSSVECKGRGMARKCEAEGGIKKDFAEYIAKLWTRINYCPSNEPHRHSSISSENSSESDLQLGGEFTPIKYVSATEKFTGVRIKHFPKNTDHGAFNGIGAARRQKRFC